MTYSPERLAELMILMANGALAAHRLTENEHDAELKRIQQWLTCKQKKSAEHYPRLVRFDHRGERTS